LSICSCKVSFVMFVSEAVGSWWDYTRNFSGCTSLPGGLQRRATAATPPEPQIMNVAHVVMKLSLFHSHRDSGKNRPH
ncbi:hypothetical protein, partial [Escherichia coli]|uniref:hypothetical protein n=1 Tax=Escherichia coli TaxID=562 RepID=UPI00227E2444